MSGCCDLLRISSKTFFADAGVSDVIAVPFIPGNLGTFHVQPHGQTNRASGEVGLAEDLLAAVVPFVGSVLVGTGQFAEPDRWHR
uniref:Uncharacterized protein n=1 Tax=Panagrolaimus sp. JU765 TaxID=591449 RepID=A0AC34QVI3_9BILA